MMSGLSLLVILPHLKRVKEKAGALRVSEL